MPAAAHSLPTTTSPRPSTQAFETILNDSGGGDGGGGGDRPHGAAGAVCAEYLSVYVDEHMRELFRGATEAEIDAKLNKVRRAAASVCWSIAVACTWVCAVTVHVARRAGFSRLHLPSHALAPVYPPR